MRELLEKIISYVNSMEEGKDEKRKRVSLELPKEEEVVVERREEKISYCRYLTCIK